MRGLSVNKILSLARNDVKKIRDNARMIVEITSSGEIKYTHNQKGKLWIIAVIGQINQQQIRKDIKDDFLRAGFLDELLKGEKLLLEIGVWRGKPYGRPKHSFEKVGRRHKWFFLSEEQYQLLANNLFGFLQGIANSRISAWNKWWNLPATKFRKYRGQNVSEAPGTRFSVAVSDAFIVSDIFWAEANLNKRRKEFLEWLASLAFNLSKKRERKSLRRFFNSRPLLEIKELWESFSPDTKKALYREFVDFFQSEGENIEKEMRYNQLVLPDPLKRMGNIQLRVERIKEGLKGKRREDHLVFEIFSSENEQPRQGL